MPNDSPVKILKETVSYSTFDVRTTEAKGIPTISSHPPTSPQPSNLRPAQNATFRNAFPVLLLVSASLFYGFMHCAVRESANQYSISIGFIVFFRSLTTFIITGALILHSRHVMFSTPLSKRFVALLILRGLTGAASMILHYAALTKLPVAIAVAIFCTKPMFASLIGFILLGERLTKTDQLALAICTLGTFIVGASQPFDISSDQSLQYLHGVMIALVAAIVSGAIYVLMRAMGTRVHYVLSVFSMSTCALISSVILYVARDGSVSLSLIDFAQQVQQLRWPAFFSLLCVGAFAFGGSMCMNRGSQLVPAGRASVLRCGDIPINFVVGFVLLKEVPDSGWQIVGSCMIAFGAYLAASKVAS